MSSPDEAELHRAKRIGLLPRTYFPCTFPCSAGKYIVALIRGARSRKEPKGPKGPKRLGD